MEEILRAFEKGEGEGGTFDFSSFARGSRNNTREKKKHRRLRDAHVIRPDKVRFGIKDNVKEC
jgi:hypothetical protein